MALGTLIPRLCSRGRAALLSRASCTASLPAPPLATSAPVPACGLQHGLAPQEERRRARTRSPCDSLRVHRSPGVAAEGRGESLRRCGGHDHV